MRVRSNGMGVVALDDAFNAPHHCSYAQRKRSYIQQHRLAPGFAMLSSQNRAFDGRSQRHHFFGVYSPKGLRPKYSSTMLRTSGIMLFHQPELRFRFLIDAVSQTHGFVADYKGFFDEFG
jgi:hypothetical protein